MTTKSHSKTLLVWCLCLLLLSMSSPANSAWNSEICDVTKDPDVKYVDVRIPETAVPDKLTTYACQYVNIPLPLDETYHAVAFEPIIVNKDVMHHMILFGCTEDLSEPVPRECGESDNHCRSFLVQWSMGIDGQICAYPDAGVRFGAGSLKSLHFQIHWNNHDEKAGMTDSSGFRIYYTTHLRKYDQGNLQVGQNDLEIPPGVAHFRQSGGCSSDCTSRWLQQPIYLTRAHLHMHYTGDGGILEIYRNGQKVRTVVEDDEYDYTHPPAHYLEEPAEVLPGDEIRMTCYFNTRDGEKKRNRTLYWGEGSDGEMCYAFITYYPLIDGFDQCIQFDHYDVCVPLKGPMVGGCLFNTFIHEFEYTMAGEILKHCGGDPSSGAYTVNGGNSDSSLEDLSLVPSALCSDDCVSAMEQVTSHPCLQGRPGRQVLRAELPKVEAWSKVKVILDAAARYCFD